MTLSTLADIGEAIGVKPRVVFERTKAAAANATHLACPHSGVIYAGMMTVDAIVKPSTQKTLGHAQTATILGKPAVFTAV